METNEYEQRVEEAFSRLFDLFEDIDVEDADLESSAGVARIQFRGGQVMVINTQRPTQQIWLAGASRGWHFAYDAGRGGWFDDRDGQQELFALVAQLTRDAIGVALPC